jgi:hypothetical protein
MMKRPLVRIAIPLPAFLGALLVLTGCAMFGTVSSTIDYREVQRDFNSAVQADNVRTAEGLGALLASTNADQLYDQVRIRLTDDQISKLDERLRLNAYALRAVSEWRTGKLGEARATAQTGLQLPNVSASPRDEIVLRMIPALVIDAQLVTAFRQAGGRLSKQTYDSQYAANFATAADAMKGVTAITATLSPATPASIINYAHLQRWRILENWNIVISKIEDGAPARQAAREDAKRRLGGVELDAEIKAEQKLIPPDDPLRKSIEALTLR